MTAYPVTEREHIRWTILALISVSHVIGATAQYAINTLAPFYQDDLELSRAQIGLFISAFYLAMTGAALGIMNTVNAAAATLGTPLFGYIVDVSRSYSTAWQALAGTLFLGILALSFFVSDPNSESPHR